MCEVIICHGMCRGEEGCICHLKVIRMFEGCFEHSKTCLIHINICLLSIIYSYFFLKTTDSYIGALCTFLLPAWKGGGGFPKLGGVCVFSPLFTFPFIHLASHKDLIQSGIQTPNHVKGTWDSHPRPPRFVSIIRFCITLVKS